jgi:hypothetical protein
LTANEEIQRLTNELDFKTSSYECGKKELEEKILSLTIQLQQTSFEKDQFCNKIQRLSHELIQEKQHVCHHLRNIQLHSTSNFIGNQELKAKVEKWTTKINGSNANARYKEQFVQCGDIEQESSSLNQNTQVLLQNRLNNLLCSLQRLPSIDTNDCQILSEENEKITTTPLIQNNSNDDPYKTLSIHYHSLHQNPQTTISTSCSKQHVRFYLQHLSQELQKFFRTIVFENNQLQIKIGKLQETIQFEKKNVKKIKTIFENELQIVSSTLASQKRELEIELKNITNNFIEISSEKNTLQHDIEMRTNELIRSSFDNNSKQKEFEQITNELASMTNELAKSSYKNNILQQEVERMTNELTRIHSEKNLLEPEVERLTIELKRIYVDKDLLQCEVESLRKELTNIFSEKDILKLEVERVTNKMSKTFSLEKDIMKLEVEKLKEDLYNEKENAKSNKQACQEELQDIISTWVVQKQKFESRIEKLLEDVATISLEKDILQQDFDKIKLITECEKEISHKCSCDEQNQKSNKFNIKKHIPMDLLENSRKGLQPLKMPTQFEIKKDVVNETHELKEPPCMVKSLMQLQINMKYKNNLKESQMKIQD